MRETREHLKPGELIIAEFSENFNFIVQDAVQSFHWNNLHNCTLIVCYHKDSHNG